MARLITGAIARTLAISLVLAAVVGLISVLHAGTDPARAQQVAPSDRSAVISALLSAVNTGDIDGAAALFANNAVLVGALPTGNCSQTTPCNDSASIRRQLTVRVAAHSCVLLRSVNVSGAVVTGQLEDRTDIIRGNGVDHILTDFIAVVPAGQITFWANVADLGDPQTALDAAITAGTQPAGTPIPNPVTPCAGVAGA